MSLALLGFKVGHQVVSLALPHCPRGNLVVPLNILCGKVCSVRLLNLDWDALIFLNFRFPIFVEIRFVFLLSSCIFSFVANWFKFGQDITCISSKVGNKIMSLALPHCLGMRCWHNQLVLSLYLHQLESGQLSFNKVTQFVTDNRTHRSDPRDTWVR